MAEIPNLDELLPDYYDGVIDMHELVMAEQGQVTKLFDETIRGMANQYVMTADATGIAVFENMLGIATDMSIDLETRRVNVLASMMNHPPYTFKFLKFLLEKFAGRVELAQYPNDFKLVVRTWLEKLGQVDQLDYLLNTIVPANLIIDSTNEITANGSGHLYVGGVVTAVESYIISNDISGTYEINNTEALASGVHTFETIEINKGA